MGTSEITRSPAEQRLIVATRSSMHALNRFRDECVAGFEDPREVIDSASFRRDRLTVMLGLDKWRKTLAVMPRDAEEELEIHAKQYTASIRSVPVLERGILLSTIYTSEAQIVEVAYKEGVQRRKLLTPEAIEIRDTTQTKGDRRQVALMLWPGEYTIKAEYMSPDGNGGREAVSLRGEFHDDANTGEITEANVIITRKEYRVGKTT